jgi:NAD-dependent DNA ligase
MQIDKTKALAEKLNIPCDGAVVTLLDRDIIDILGRKDDKNMFQVAFKFPAGEEKTTIEAVDFQVGPIAGRLTPVARLKPIVINGNTISNVTVSNKAKLERLQLHVGDEVLIRYDIIPSIFKTADCKESNNPIIEFPTTCPICGGDIVDEVCTNPDCPSKTVGHIANYVNRLDIKGGLGVEKIVQLVDAGLLTTIGDLYRLRLHRAEMCELERWGETSVDKILSGISDATSLYQHQILGSIGNLGHLEELIIPMQQIPGIGEKSAKAIVEGIERKSSVIEDICHNVDIKQYDVEKTYDATVCFTSTHNTEAFEAYLESINVHVQDTFTKTTDFLIIPDETLAKPSSKMVKAEKWGTPMLRLSDAKKKWSYEGD